MSQKLQKGGHLNLKGVHVIPCMLNCLIVFLILPSSEKHICLGKGHVSYTSMKWLVYCVLLLMTLGQKLGALLGTFKESLGRSDGSWKEGR